jgi:hypothetical protein
MLVDLATFTVFHTILSLVALAAGVVGVAGLFGAPVHRYWTVLFLVTSIATSVTGFGFPFNGLLPSHIVGGVALLVLAAALYAGYLARPPGSWPRIYAVGLVVSLYFLVFVAIAQAFLKVAYLKSTAPTSTELPFVAAQLATLALFIFLAIAAGRAARSDGHMPIAVVQDAS